MKKITNNLFLAKNIKFLREGKDLSQTALAADLGVTRDNVASYERGTEPTLTKLFEIGNYFHIGVDDLCRRDLQKEGKAPVKAAVKGKILEMPTLQLPSNVEAGLVKMPVKDLQYAAGASAYAPEFLETADFVFIPSSWVKAGRHYECGRIRGSSMAPTLLDSGYGIIRLLERSEWKNMPDEEVYVVVSKEDTTANVQIKRVKNRFNKGFIVMMSDNPDKASFPNFNIPSEEIVSIWHLDWYFTSRMPNIHNQYYSRLQSLEDKVEELIEELRPTLKRG